MARWGRSAVAKAPLQRGDQLLPGPVQGAQPVGAAARKGRPPAVVAVARGHDRMRPARKGLPPAAKPQGVATSGQLARACRPWPGYNGRLPVTRLQGGGRQQPALPPVARVAAP
ncbi:hypothetical protein B296_00057399 [Ensete ventricosum]|uniref:Uncharacterized protein n=1 Tax=Ensete ventricosum TaxID=4639 RepID=A0A426X0R1_ENSVE|nr:hypothetical protein B296_00057399 [Ensete ventricosum]